MYKGEQPALRDAADARTAKHWRRHPLGRPRAASYDALSEPVQTLLEGLYAYHVHPDYYLTDGGSVAAVRAASSAGRLTAGETGGAEDAPRPERAPARPPSSPENRPEALLGQRPAHRAHPGGPVQGRERRDPSNLIFRQQLKPEFCHQVALDPPVTSRSGTTGGRCTPASNGLRQDADAPWTARQHRNG